MPNLLFDAHLGISWNALAFDRDQTRTISEIRAREVAMPEKARGRNTVSLPEMRRAGIGVCLATVLARAKPGVSPVEAQKRIDLDYVNQDVAYAVACGQLAYYRLLETRGEMRMIRTRGDRAEVWSAWERDGATVGSADRGSSERTEHGRQSRPWHQTAPIGFILSMEGCDPIVEPAQAEHWFEQGLRTASLAHYGQSAYAFGTGGDGPVTPRGRELLKQFERLGMILDLTHTADTGFYEALSRFGGRVFASHNNCRALVAGDRQYSDDQVKRLVERDAVIGAVLDAWMLYPQGWKKGQTTPDAVSMEDVANQIDHVCQLAGNARHVGIGSDLDGGYGTEQTPGDLDTIADLHKLRPILKGRGYSEPDLDLIFWGNWLRFFGEALPVG
jgi:membrane dipeptidase